MKKRGKLVILAITGMLAIFAGAAVSVMDRGDPERLGVEARFAATSKVRVLNSEDWPAPIENEGDGRHVWAMRKNAENASIEPVFIMAAQFILDAPRMVERLTRGGEEPLARLLAANAGFPEPDAHLAPILSQDGASPPMLLAALPSGEAFDPSGMPLRWHLPENIIAGYSLFRPARPEPEAPQEQARPRIVVNNAPRGAAHYRELVADFARRYNLSAELVMAIIHSESAFSPTLVSSKSAMGLMQLLPSTASDEVHRFLYGRRGQVSFEELSVPEINIRYGTAYLHILFNRYFQGVVDDNVREYCAVASYNLGPNRFLRLYGPTPELAVARINSMDAEEFYKDLATRLPTRETRFYVEKVRRMKQHYSPR